MNGKCGFGYRKPNKKGREPGWGRIFVRILHIPGALIWFRGVVMAPLAGLLGHLSADFVAIFEGGVAGLGLTLFLLCAFAG